MSFRRNLLASLVASALAFMTSAGVARAQTKPSPKVAHLIECHIKTETNALSPGSDAVVTVTIKNTSDRSLDLEGSYSFRLEKEGDPDPYGPEAYWSPVDLLKSTTLKLDVLEPEMLKKGVVVGRAPETTVRLEKGASREFRLDLTRLLWNRSGNNDWPRWNLFESVPVGTYLLKFLIRTDRDVNAQGTPIAATVTSNAVRVTVEPARPRAGRSSDVREAALLSYSLTRAARPRFSDKASEG